MAAAFFPAVPIWDQPLDAIRDFTLAEKQLQ
jgi:hypothetical protein